MRWFDGSMESSLAGFKVSVPSTPLFQLVETHFERVSPAYLTGCLLRTPMLSIGHTPRTCGSFRSKKCKSAPTQRGEN